MREVDDQFVFALLGLARGALAAQGLLPEAVELLLHAAQGRAQAHRLLPGGDELLRGVDHLVQVAQGLGHEGIGEDRPARKQGDAERQRQIVQQQVFQKQHVYVQHIIHSPPSFCPSL